MLSSSLKAQLDKAAEIIRAGGLVVVPTETFYGLAVDPFQEDAVEKIFGVKIRDRGKPLPLIAGSMESVASLVELFPPWVDALMQAFWPGSLTILLRPSAAVPSLITGPLEKIGVRVPPPCAARELARLSGGWVTATSANLSGDPSADEVAKIAPEVLRSADIVLDLGATSGGMPSTVVEPLESSLRIIREGAVAVSSLLDFAAAHGLQLVTE